MALASTKLRTLVARDLVPSLAQFQSNVLSSRRSMGPMGQRVRIGICVSGGPDSMALAYLLTKLRREDLKFELEPFAFIVDHNARQGSAEEANFVARQLAMLGISPQILEITWPDGVVPLKLANFEMLARQSRYRLIAQAALQSSIKHLFLGHHRDDQVETLLMRMTRDAHPSFLAFQGMSEGGPVPCCDSIWGARNDELSLTNANVVEKAGSTLSGNMELTRTNPPDVTTPLYGMTGHLRSLPSGGITVYRPLLPFPKSVLVQTCDVNGISFVRDKTNDDPGLTRRNTIRHLRAHYQLPRALQDQSLLDLCRRSREMLETTQRRGRSSLGRIELRSLDLRSGSMVVRVPKDLAGLDSGDSRAVANMVVRLTKMVSPRPSDDMPTLAPEHLVKRFLDLLGHRCWEQQDGPPPTMTIHRVFWEALCGPGVVGRPDTVWRLSRQPMRQDEIAHTTLTFEVDDAEGTPTHTVWSKRILWDYRYWLRIRASSAEALKQMNVRPYRVSDNPELRKNLTGSQWQHLTEILHQSAAAKIRYTLPVITFQDSVIAFPTLPFHADPHSVLQDWDIYYKVIEDLGLMKGAVESESLSLDTAERI